MDMEQVLTFISKLDSKEDLSKINREVKSRWGRLTAYSAMEYAIGDSVRFETREGTTLTGVIERVNRKSCTIRIPGEKGNWRVHPDFLRKAD